MKKIKPIAIIVISLLIGGYIGYLIGLEVMRRRDASICIKYRDKQIKNILKSAPPGTVYANSGPDGVERFLKTGFLVPEMKHYINLEEALEGTLYHIKFSPQRTTGWNDGWIEQKDIDEWYIKHY